MPGSYHFQEEIAFSIIFSMKFRKIITKQNWWPGAFEELDQQIRGF